MMWLYLIILIFSLLTLHYIYNEYKQEKISKKSFILISCMEILVVVTTIILLIETFNK